GDVALAALRAGVEGEEVLPVEVADPSVPDLLGRRVRGEQRQPLAGPLIADADVRWGREHVDGLREGNRRDERERDDAVRPPGREVRARGLLRRHPERAEAAGDDPAE